jgi:hypothetical protein
MLAEHLGDSQFQILRSTIEKICVMNGREWLFAMRGDAAASIATAIDMSPINKITLEVDLVMTVLMLRALDGNAAAALVLSHLLRRAPLDHPFSQELSASWLVLNSRRGLNTSKRTLNRLHNSSTSSDHSTGRVASFVRSHV